MNEDEPDKNASKDDDVDAMQSLQVRFEKAVLQHDPDTEEFAYMWSLNIDSDLEIRRENREGNLRLEWLNSLLRGDDVSTPERRSRYASLPFREVIEQGTIRNVPWLLEITLSRTESLRAVPTRERTPEQERELRWNQSLLAVAVAHRNGWSYLPPELERSLRNFKPDEKFREQVRQIRKMAERGVRYFDLKDIPENERTKSEQDFIDEYEEARRTRRTDLDCD